MIKPVRLLVAVEGKNFKYRICDGREFLDLDEAVEEDNKLHASEPKKPVEYEQFWTIQAAINKAVAENRVVRFLYEGDTAELKKGIDDRKGCKLLKPDKEAKEVAVVPPSVTDFVF